MTVMSTMKPIEHPEYLAACEVARRKWRIARDLAHVAGDTMDAWKAVERRLYALAREKCGNGHDPERFAVLEVRWFEIQEEAAVLARAWQVAEEKRRCAAHVAQYATIQSYAVLDCVIARMKGGQH